MAKHNMASQQKANILLFVRFLRILFQVFDSDHIDKTFNFESQRFHLQVFKF